MLRNFRSCYGDTMHNNLFTDALTAPRRFTIFVPLFKIMIRHFNSHEIQLTFLGYGNWLSARGQGCPPLNDLFPKIFSENNRNNSVLFSKQSLIFFFPQFFSSRMPGRVRTGQGNLEI